MRRETQMFINAFINNSAAFDRPQPLKVDGIHGPLTRAAAMWVAERLRRKVLKEELVWSETMFIGLRTDLDLDNSFDDWFIFINTKGPLTFLACPASTVSGTPGIAKYANRIIRGRSGVGTIAENQQIDYQVVVPQRGNAWSMWTGGLGFLFQDKPIRLYRGAFWQNAHWWINRSNPVEGDLGGGFNVHSWSGWGLDLVQNLSEGCQVCKAVYWAELFPLLVKNARNGRITYTLIQYL